MPAGTKDDPWVLKTPPGTSEYTMYRDETRDPPALVCQVGKTQLTLPRCAASRTSTRCSSSTATGWRSARPTSRSPARRTPSRRGARSETNPVGGWYGLRKGYRGRFGMYVPPLLEELGLAELEHNPRNNRMRAI